MARTGIILANTGTPDSPAPEDVRNYLEQFLSNPRIVPMNKRAWWLILHLFILPSRKNSSGEKYKTIWTDEGFAFIRDHKTLAYAVQQAYNASGADVAVECAMSFGNPSIENVMRRLHDIGCERLIVLPLYPQNAFSQASIVTDAVELHAPSTGWQDAYEFIDDYSSNEAYLAAIADSIQKAGFDTDRDRLLMSFHSIPRTDVERGDTYGTNVRLTCLDIARRLGLDDKSWAQAYQSRFDKGRAWLGPFTGEVLQKLAEEEFDGRLFVVCPNFSVDCLETYYDIDNIMRNAWAELHRGRGDCPEFVYVPCLGASEAHVNVIMDVLKRSGAALC